MIISWDAHLYNPLLLLNNGIFLHTMVNGHFFRLEEDNDEYINNYYHLDPPPQGVSLNIIKKARLKRKRNNASLAFGKTSAGIVWCFLGALSHYLYTFSQCIYPTDFFNRSLGEIIALVWSREA